MDVEQQVKILRRSIADHGCVTFDRKDALARWSEAVRRLEAEGFCESRLIESGEQSTALEVRRKR